MYISLIIFVLGLLTSHAHQLQDYADKVRITKPLEGKTGAAAALIFFVGASCTPESYDAHMKAIQTKISFPLWIGQPIFPGNLPIPVDLTHYTKIAREALQTAMGDQKVYKYFYGGHSLGGASVSEVVHADPTTAEGVFAWGAYVDRKVVDPAKNYGAPYLTVGAELDGGLARIIRIAESYDQMKSTSMDPARAKYSYPVVVIPGMNHASYLSGTPPAAVQTSDLRSKISAKSAINHISNVVAAFITITREGQDAPASQISKVALDYYIFNLTAPLVEPIIRMLAEEGAPFMSGYKNMTPWAKHAQSFAAGELNDKYTFLLSDEWVK